MGEILHSMFNEAVGNDKHDRQIAASPLRIFNAGANVAGGIAIVSLAAIDFEI